VTVALALHHCCQPAEATVARVRWLSTLNGLFNFHQP
jgi:hypothetical protein